MVQLSQAGRESARAAVVRKKSQRTLRPSHETKLRDPPRQMGRKERSKGPNFLPSSACSTAERVSVEQHTTPTSAHAPSKTGQMASEVRCRR